MANAVASLPIYLTFGAWVAAIALGVIVAAILFPPLGAMTVLAGLFGRAIKKNRRK